MAAKGEARRLVKVPFFRWLSNLFTLSVYDTWEVGRKCPPAYKETT